MVFSQEKKVKFVWRGFIQAEAIKSNYTEYSCLQAMVDLCGCLSFLAVCYIPEKIGRLGDVGTGRYYQATQLPLTLTSKEFFKEVRFD